MAALRTSSGPKGYMIGELVVLLFSQIKSNKPKFFSRDFFFFCFNKSNFSVEKLILSHLGNQGHIESLSYTDRICPF